MTTAMTPTAIDLSDYTIFVGAGISVNSGCPLFKDFWSAFLEAGLFRAQLSDADQIMVDASHMMEVFPSEQLLYRLQTAGRRERQSLIRTLLRYLDGRQPNSNHVALSMMLTAKANVWTTNYDTLIEAAIGPENCHVIAWPDSPECDCPKPHIMKPHGSFRPGKPDDQHLIFDSAGVLDMRDDWKKAFALALHERHIIVAGQRGQDIDLMPILRQEAQHGIRSGVWYEFAGENRDALKRKVPRFDLPDCSDPSLAFQDRCSKLLSRPVLAVPPITPEKVIAVDFPYSHLAAAVILDHFAPPALVRRELTAAIRHDRLMLRFVAFRRFARSQLFDNPHISRPVEAVSKLLLRAPLRPLSVWAWRLYLLAAMTHVSAGVGREITRAVERGAAARWSFPLRTNAASSLKLTGPLGPILRLLPEADLVRQAPSNRGFAVYTLLWTVRNIGDLTSWRRLWDAESASAAMFDPNWAAWLRIEQANLACMLGKGDEALLALQADETQFAVKRKRHPLFVFEYEMSLLQTQALTSAHPPASDPSEPVETMLRTLVKTPALDTPFRRASLQITAASLAPDPKKALTLIEEAERTTPSGLHRVLLGVLRIRIRTQGRGPTPEQLLLESRRLRFGYGEALLLSELKGTTLAPHADAQQLLTAWTTPPTVWIVP